nr:MAG TPA: hypothetical protein [Caudoviricetes sp.]
MYHFEKFILHHTMHESYLINIFPLHPPDASVRTF